MTTTAPEHEATKDCWCEPEVVKVPATTEMDALIAIVGVAVMLVATRTDTSVGGHWVDELSDAVERYAPGLVAETQQRMIDQAYAAGADD